MRRSLKKAIIARLKQPPAGRLAQRGKSRTSKRFSRRDQHDLVGEAEFDQPCGDPRAAFAEDAGDAPRGERLERLVQVDMALGVRPDAHDLDAALPKPAGGF